MMVSINYMFAAFVVLFIEVTNMPHLIIEIGVYEKHNNCINDCV